jgi:hypothetical protein
MKSKALKAIVSIIGLLLVLCVCANSLAAEGLFFDLEWVVHIPPEVETEHLISATDSAQPRPDEIV